MDLLLLLQLIQTVLLVLIVVCTSSASTWARKLYKHMAEGN